MEKSRMDIKNVLTQFILIVFSVVLGLYLSERIEENKKKQDSEVLLGKIKSEVKENIKLLRYWVPYHQEMKKKLDSLVRDEAFIKGFINNKYFLYEKILTRGTFMGRMPSSDGWDIAKSHPLTVNIEYEKLLILSKIYNQQATTFEPGMQMFELLNSKDVNREKDTETNLELITNHMRELVAREEQLLFYYKEAESILDLQDKEEMDK